MQVYIVMQYGDYFGAEIKEIQLVVDSAEKAQDAVNRFRLSNPKGKFKYETYFLR